MCNYSFFKVMSNNHVVVLQPSSFFFVFSRPHIFIFSDFFFWNFFFTRWKSHRENLLVGSFDKFIREWMHSINLSDVRKNNIPKRFVCLIWIYSESKSEREMSGYGRDRRDYDRGDRGGDRDRSSHRGYDRGKWTFAWLFSTCWRFSCRNLLASLVWFSLF